MIWGSGGSKSRLAKAAGAEPAGQMRDKNCTPLWREAHLQVKMYKTHHVRTTFGSCDVEKVHAVVARSAFPSQNVQSTPLSDHFWKLSCGKSARRCGAKHMSKSKCTKHHMFAPLLEVRMLKKCTSLWCEAHVEVKMYKAPHVRATFGGSDVEKVHGAKQISKSKCTKHHMFAPLLEVRMSLRFTTLHYTTLRSTTLRSTTLHSTTLQLHNYTPLHSTTLHYTLLHSTTLNSTTLHYITLHYTPLHYTTLHYTTFHYTSLHYTTLHLQLQLRLHNYTPLHEITLHYTTLHYTTFHYTPLHYTTLHYTTIH